jgi:hypothetical protein
MIAGFAVALFACAVVHLSSAVHPNGTDRPATPTRLRRWLNALFDRMWKAPNDKYTNKLYVPVFTEMRLRLELTRNQPNAAATIAPLNVAKACDRADSPASTCGPSI